MELSECAPKASKNVVDRPWSHRPHSGSVWSMDVRQRLAANMKRLRKERGWSQEELADKANLDRTYISGIERIKKSPSVTVVEKIAKALECSLGDLLDSQ